MKNPQRRWHCGSVRRFRTVPDGSGTRVSQRVVHERSKINGSRRYRVKRGQNGGSQELCTGMVRNLEGDGRCWCSFDFAEPSLSDFLPRNLALSSSTRLSAMLALWAAHQCRQPAQGQASVQTHGRPLPCRPNRCDSSFYRPRRSIPTKTLLYYLWHHVLYVVTPIACGAGQPAHDFPVTSVPHKLDAQLNAIVAIHLETVRAPRDVPACFTGDSVTNHAAS